MSEEKKRLKLMPELLPDPRLARNDRDARPRERTIEHMKTLLALTASASALAACSRGYAVVDPLPPPPTATIGPPKGPPDAGADAESPFGPFGPPTSDADLGTMDAGSAKDDTPDAAPKKKHPPIVSTVPTRGYMVVDPLPPPPTTSTTKPRKP